MYIFFVLAFLFIYIFKQKFLALVVTFMQKSEKDVVKDIILLH